MIAGRSSNDFQPISWVGRFPIYATTLLVILYVVAAIVNALLMATGNQGVQELFSFSTYAVLREFQVWKILTYPVVLLQIDLWFAVQMYMLYAFGREVEKFLGRRAFLLLYAALLVSAPLFLLVLGIAGIPSAYAGSSALNFAVFVAFAVIYPNAEIFFSLKAKWIAAILIGIYVLQMISVQAWVFVGVMLFQCACAFLILRGAGVGNWGFIDQIIERAKKAAPRKGTVRKVKPEQPSEVDPHAIIDPLLEKISKHGISSLTRRERESLEKARESLLQNERKS